MKTSTLYLVILITISNFRFVSGRATFTCHVSFGTPTTDYLGWANTSTITSLTIRTVPGIPINISSPGPSEAAKPPALFAVNTKRIRSDGNPRGLFPQLIIATITCKA